MRWGLDNKLGFTLVETLVAIGLFAVVGVGIYGVYVRIIDATQVLRAKNVATFLVNEQFEIIRNLPYADVGTDGGIPNGVIEPTQNISRENFDFVVTTTIRNIDDPFDGTLGGSPNDLSPADNKLVEVSIDCSNCDDFTDIVYTTRVAPRNLETASDNGALFIQVFDANGVPIQGADVSVDNTNVSPIIDIDDVTDANGYLQIVDAPPDVEGYEISVTETGYSTDQTYEPGAPSNPNPLKPHSTVALQTVTQVSFAIDQTADVTVNSVSPTCVSVADIDYQLSGSKMIGTPDVLKYDQSQTTGGTGSHTITGMEWDTYDLSLTDTTYDLAGMSPINPFALDPGNNQTVQLTVVPQNPSSLLVVVKDLGTGLPLSDATATLSQTTPVFSEDLVTGRGFLTQTDWSGGSGQDDFTDPTKYHSSSTVDINAPDGEVKLQWLITDYATDGELTSSTFDIGSPGNFHELLWLPEDQPPAAGTDAVRFQIATNTDNLTWNYVGPDGTSGTYFTNANRTIHSSHNGDQYLRYRVFLHTDDTSVTPNISDVSFTYTSDCVAPGQVLFDGLSSGTYDLQVVRSGYQTYDQEVEITSNWQATSVELTP